MIASPKNFIEQFQNFIEHIAGVMKTFLTKEVADNYYLGKSEEAVSAGSVQWEGVEDVPNNVKNALSFIAQTLTEAQKQQARTNIGAMSAATLPSVPAGTLLPFAGTAVPDGYLLCNGAEVSRTDYANLFAAIGTKWGEGDGSTTFTLPNFNDRFIEGTTDTEKVGQYLEAGAPNITGIVSPGGIIWGSPSGAFYSDGGKNAPYKSPEGGANIKFDASKGNSVYSKNTIQPESFYALIIIKE